MNGLTLEQVWVIIVWSLKALESGRHPEEDWYGMPICDGPFFALKGSLLAEGFSPMSGNSAQTLNIRTIAQVCLGIDPAQVRATHDNATQRSVLQCFTGISVLPHNGKTLFGWTWTCGVSGALCEARTSICF